MNPNYSLCNLDIVSFSEGGMEKMQWKRTAMYTLNNCASFHLRLGNSADAGRSLIVHILI